ncbi:hypothetical protein RJ639_032606, partial [Escallonia herrerae]
GKGDRKGDMPAVWFTLKRSMHCKSEPSDVHDPRLNNGSLSKILTKKTGRSGCSRSIANLKDVIHGSKRHMERAPSCSPRSIGSSELLNPIAHEVVLSSSTCELKITGFGTSVQDGKGHGEGEGESFSTFVGTLKPGTPGPGGHLVPSYNLRNAANLLRKNQHSLSTRSSGFVGIPSKPRGSFELDSPGLTCHKCGEQFAKWEAIEAHHLSEHAGKWNPFIYYQNTTSKITALKIRTVFDSKSKMSSAVTELAEGDSSRKIVELIYRTSWSKSSSNCGRIERILKVHNMQNTLAQFEEHREIVKIKASKLPKKHPRCLADGNELLRFHGTTVECSLGMNGSSSLCTSDGCSVCEILRHGFSTKKEVNGGVGVFTTSTSGRAFESIEICDDNATLRKALIVCRVIAGRVHRPLENVQELAGQSGFDSLAGKVGLCSNIEELYLLNPKALLPCFVIICKP